MPLELRQQKKKKKTTTNKRKNRTKNWNLAKKKFEFLLEIPGRGYGGDVKPLESATRDEIGDGNDEHQLHEENRSQIEPERAQNGREASNDDHRHEQAP